MCEGEVQRKWLEKLVDLEAWSQIFFNSCTTRWLVSPERFFSGSHSLLSYSSSFSFLIWKQVVCFVTPTPSSSLPLFEWSVVSSKKYMSVWAFTMFMATCVKKQAKQWKKRRERMRNEKTVWEIYGLPVPRNRLSFYFTNTESDRLTDCWEKQRR